MEKVMTKNNGEQEIDLLEILQRFGRWFGRILCAVFIFLLRKSPWLVCFAVAGAAVGVGLYVSKRPYYNTHMLLQANVVDNFFYVNLINEELAIENIRNPLDWVRKLAIPATIAKQIYSIRACYGVDINKDGLPDIIDENNKYISSKDSSKVAQILRGSFYVNVLAYSHDVLPHVRQSVVDFINKNDYVQRHNEQRIAATNEQIAYIQQQINRFDSLQRYEYFQKESEKRASAGGQQLLILNELPQPLYHADLIGLNDQVLSKQTSLRLYSDPVTIVQEFAETYRRKNNAMSYIRPLAIGAFLIGLAFLIFWDCRKNLWKLYKGQ